MTTGPHALRCTPRRTGRDISLNGPAVVRLLIEAGADPDAPVGRVLALPGTAALGGEQ